MNTPRDLTTQQLEAVANLLQQAREQLRDAAGERVLVDRYGPTAVRIAEVLRDLGVEPE